MRSKFKWIFTLLVALTMQVSFAQEKTVTGIVTDATGPMPGVNVAIKGTQKGVSTGFDGSFSIKAKVGEVLVFTFMGMDDVSRTVGAESSIKVKMVDNTTTLGEVVVVANLGYFKRDINKIATGVSTISSEEISRQASSISVANALQGKAAGVQVTTMNGKPGQAAFVSVRGAVSITGATAQATYVVDGAFVAASEISAINAADVENVTVLKDGASAAIYGIRGGNGVVVITTKKGKGSKTKFEFNSSIGFTRKIKDNFRMMNAAEKISYEDQIQDGPSFGASPADTALLLSYNHDWQDTLLQDGFQQNTTFSYSGSDNKFSNRFSIGYNEDKGIIRNINAYNRISGRYNAEYDASNWIKFNFNVGGSYEKYGQPRDRNNVQNPFNAMYNYNPYEPVYARDPITGNILYNTDGTPQYNVPVAGFPVAEALVNNTEFERFFRLYGRPSVDIKLYKGLVLSSKINLNYERRQREAFTKPGSFLDVIVSGADPLKGSKTDAGWDSFEYQWTNQLAYNFKIGESNSFVATLLYEYYKNNFRSHTLTKKGFTNGDLDTAGTAVVGVPAVTRVENSTLSYYAGLEYDYKGKYIASASFRRDGSSQLGVNNKYSNAFGGSLGWVVSEEFFPNNRYVNNLKLRASYGELNSLNGTTAYNAQTTFGTTNYAGASGVVVSNSSVGNPDLKFEKVKKLDIGFESAFLNRRLTLSSSYFKDKRVDFIYSDNVSNGPDWATLINAGNWTAKGIELEIRGTVLKTENTNLVLYFNGASFDRKIDLLNRPNDPNNRLLRGLTVNQVGYQPDEYYLVPYAGIDQTNGHALYRKLDGSLTDVYTENDRVLTGKTPYAKYEGGFGLEFKFHGFDLAADFNFKQGNYSYNYIWFNANADGTSASSNQAVDAFDYWSTGNTTASQPAPFSVTGIDSNQTSDRFLQDASYIRFRSLNLGYTLGKKHLAKLPIDQIRVYTQMQNLLTWTKFKGDPEVGIGSGETQTNNSAIPGQYNLYSYPTLQSFTFGLSVNF